MYEIPRFLPDCVIQVGALNDRQITFYGGCLRRRSRRKHPPPKKPFESRVIPRHYSRKEQEIKVVNSKFKISNFSQFKISSFYVMLSVF